MSCDHPQSSSCVPNNNNKQPTTTEQQHNHNNKNHNNNNKNHNHKNNNNKQQTTNNSRQRYVPLDQTTCCLLLLTGVACCLPTCAQGSSVSVTGSGGDGSFWAFWVLLGALCIWGLLAWLVNLCVGLGLLRCASCWTRPLGGGRWGHYLCNLWGEYLKIHKTAYMYYGSWLGFFMWKPYMLALAGQPSLHGDYACVVYWNKGALRREIAGRNNIRPLFLLLGFFCLVEILLNDSGV